MRAYPNVPIWMRPTDWEWHRDSTPYTRQEWTSDDIEMMQVMFDNGVEIKDIAVQLGRTYDSVRCKHVKYNRIRNEIL